jgi:hypothetical protein
VGVEEKGRRGERKGGKYLQASKQAPTVSECRRRCQKVVTGALAGMGYAWRGLAYAPRTPVLFVGPTDALNRPIRTPVPHTRNFCNNYFVNFNVHFEFQVIREIQHCTTAQYDTMQYNNHNISYQSVHGQLYCIVPSSRQNNRRSSPSVHTTRRPASQHSNSLS